MKHSLGILLLIAWHSLGAAAWEMAQPGWSYQFPADHHAHGGFKTEWWYFTGNLADEAGHRFGYELTFFRQGIRPPSERDPEMSRFVIGDLKFAHFAITDESGKRFRFEQRTSRGSFGDAGFDEGERLAWIDDWTLTMRADGGFALSARMKDASLQLELRARKPPVVHGANGISAKSSETGHASHYYSLTRLETSGELALAGKALRLRGESWFDHEWASNQLAANQIGWNWLSAQFDDGTELMLYQMRLANGAEDPSSSGTWIDADGGSVSLANTDFKMNPSAFWKSGLTKANYPVGWRIELPGRGLQIEVRPLLPEQELALMPLAYWEGAIEITGTRAGRAIKGRGYLELTGYAGPLRELQR